MVHCSRLHFLLCRHYYLRYRYDQMAYCLSNVIGKKKHLFIQNSIGFHPPIDDDDDDKQIRPLGTGKWFPSFYHI